MTISSEEQSSVGMASSNGCAVTAAAGVSLTTDNGQPTTDFRLSAEIRNELKSVETEIKYAGYLDQQTKAIERLKRSEQRTIPDWFDYGKVSGLSREMNEKLSRVRPRTLGTGQPHSRGDARRGVANQRLHRDSGPWPVQRRFLLV